MRLCGSTIMMIQYNKLVRDRIPEIIERSGGMCSTRTCSKDEIMKYLVEKLKEEIAEFRQNESVEELADILEVCYALIEEMGNTRTEVEDIRKKKREKRGAFRKRIILIEASDPASRRKSPK